MIRPATHEDTPALVELGALLHQISSYSSMAYNPAKAAQFLDALIDGLGVVFVAVVDGEVVGGFAGAVTEQWFSDDLIAYDYSFFVDPARRQGLLSRKLALAFQEWARIKGAKQLHMGVGTGLHVEATTRFYESLGLKHFGPLMMKEL
ncbi:GNAT family N-acetyltransferase [Pseudomonas viridiflava]|uniref:GNAT family N-acetyltransferase n=1 Tax=Pseudomonas viridiflava TaxID=33069 RepID=UPI001C316284|nr:GNAT family N-acetyltransferase [Pseudomonas viridiflava]QXG34033.1 GNAT family N-acetyltransferase [Pseudomonas viridiflava]QXG42254.1 GNAT family N-acetyltransferase [Pseudomonas viridiflava]